MSTQLPASQGETPPEPKPNPQPGPVPADGLVGLIRANRDFRLLWAGNLAGVCGGWFTAVAAFAMIYAHGGSAFAAGTVLALRYLPGLLIGPLGGVLADRRDRRAIMLACQLCAAVLVLGHLLADSPGTLWLLYPLTFVSAAVGYVFQAARNAWMPSLVLPDEYVLYAAAVQVNGLLLQAVGGLTGAAAVTLAGPRWAFALNSALLLLSAWCTWRVTAGRRHGTATPPDGRRRLFGLPDLLDGIRTARASRVVSALLALEFVFCLGLGGMITAMTHLALRVHDLGDGGTGWFYAVQGTAGAAVLLLASGRLQQLTPAGRLRLLGLSCLAEGAAAAAMGLPTAVVPALLLWGLAAAAEVVYNPLATATLLAGVPNSHRGRVLSLWTATATTALAISAATSGHILDTHGHGPLFAALGLLMATPAALWLLAHARGQLTG